MQWGVEPSRGVLSSCVCEALYPISRVAKRTKPRGKKLEDFQFASGLGEYFPTVVTGFKAVDVFWGVPFPSVPGVATVVPEIRPRLVTVVSTWTVFS